MRVFLDNCLPRTLKPQMATNCHIEHARDRQWGTLSNGELLEFVEADFDIFITVDRAQRKQQDEQNKGYEKYNLGFIILRVFSNRLEHILPFVNEINELLNVVKHGEVHYIGEPQLLKELL